MKKGYGKTLEVKDMYNVCPEDKSQILGDKLERYLFIVCLFYKKKFMRIYDVVYSSG